jgi:plastocyanin
MSFAASQPRRRSIGAALLCALLAAAAGMLASPARADQQIQAVFPTQYSTTSVTIDQGERLTFQNLDISDHDVTATTRGADAKPLFGTPLIGTGEEAFVEGSQYLTEGQYPFVCSIHANMQGTLHVTASGTPVPRPGGGGGGGGVAADKTKPKLRLRLLSTRASRVRRVGELVVEVRVDEAAKVGLTATARSGRRRVTIATGSAELTASGTRRPELKLTRAGRKLLKKKRRLPVAVSGRAIDSAGNTSAASARGTLRR